MHSDVDRNRTALDDVTGSLGVRVDAILRQTNKSLLAIGLWRDRPIVVKLLLATDDFWTGKWQHEITVYRALTQAAPPIRVPDLLHTDGRSLMILELLPGVPLDHERYPQYALENVTVTAALDCLIALADWKPGSGFRRVFDYAERVDRYHAKGLLDDADRQALTSLLECCSDVWELNHGDPLPSNLICDGHQCGLIDWEFTGLYLPGFDLALLRTVLTRSPQAVAAIDRIVTNRGIEIPFAVNLAMVLTRELRLHQELPEGHPHRDRLPLLEWAWETARHRLRDLAGGT